MRDWTAVLGLWALLARGGGAQLINSAYMVKVPLSDLVANFNQMAVGEQRVARGAASGAPGVMYSKLSASTFRVVVYKGDPAALSPEFIYTANYRWVTSMQTLMAVECTFAPPPPTIDVIMNCDHGLRMAVLLMRIVLRPPLTDLTTSGYQALVSCIQTKTAFVLSHAYQVCSLLSLSDMTIAAEMLQRQQALSALGNLSSMQPFISMARARSALVPHLGDL